jgi:hypothetical protein
MPIEEGLTMSTEEQIRNYARLLWRSCPEKVSLFGEKVYLPQPELHPL